MITLDENFRIESDTNEWVLIFEQEGEINTKTNKPAIKKDKWHCGSLSLALKRYTNEVTKVGTNVNELIVILTKVETKIDALKNNTK